MSVGRSTRRAGFTLLEMMVSLVVISVIMTAVGSTMLLAQRALGLAVDDLERDPLADSLDEMATDLALAREFTFRTGRSVGVWVPDRDGDGEMEHIVYGWDGDPGTALMRQENFGDVASLAEGVLTLDLDWVERPVQPTRIDMIESGPTLLYGHAPSGSNTLNGTIDAQRQHAAWFSATIPGDALHWSVNRVLFRARRAGSADGSLVVEIRTAEANAPSEVVIAAVAVPEWTLGSDYEWIEVAFPTVTHLDPGQALCVVIAGSGDADAGDVELDNNSATETPDAGYVRTTDGGNTWNAFSNRDLLLYVYGTSTAAEPAS